MTQVVLRNPDIGLFTRFIATRIELPQLDQQDPSDTLDMVPVQFDGYDFPTVYRGTTRQREWSLAVTFTPAQQALAVALMDLFETAFTAGDGRLQLRTSGSSVAGLDRTNVIAVNAWSSARLDGGAIQVSFHAYAAEWSLDELSEPAITWADVDARYATAADLVAAYATVADLLAARELI